MAYIRFYTILTHFGKVTHASFTYPNTLKDALELRPTPICGALVGRNTRIGLF